MSLDLHSRSLFNIATRSLSEFRDLAREHDRPVHEKAQSRTAAGDEGGAAFQLDLISWRRWRRWRRRWWRRRWWRWRWRWWRRLRRRRWWRRRWRNHRGLRHAHPIARDDDHDRPRIASVRRDRNSDGSIAATGCRRDRGPRRIARCRPVADGVRANLSLQRAACGGNRVRRPPYLELARAGLLSELEPAVADDERARPRNRIRIAIDAKRDRAIALPLAAGSDGEPAGRARCRPRALAGHADRQRARATVRTERAR